MAAAIVFGSDPRMEHIMTKPPPSGPHSDLTGVNRDARAGVPNRDAGKGTAADIESAREHSRGKPAPKDDQGG